MIFQCEEHIEPNWFLVCEQNDKERTLLTLSTDIFFQKDYKIMQKDSNQHHLIDYCLLHFPQYGEILDTTNNAFLTSCHIIFHSSTLS